MTGNSAAQAATQTNAKTSASPLYAWIVVSLLCLLYVVSFLDRMILVLLIDPISSDLGLSDTQMGLLIGFAFAVLYVLIGLPIAHIADSGHRRIVLVIGVALWGVATILSAFANSFAYLLVMRAAVAIGEAALSPVAISLIGDLFKPEKRAFPTSLYMATGVLMGTGAFMLGGGAIKLAESFAVGMDWEAWRITLVIVGAPTVLLAGVAALVIREPERSRKADKTLHAEPAIPYLKKEWRLYLGLFGGVGALSAISWGIISWVPTLLIRAHAFDPAQAGFILGIVGPPAAILGTLFSPWAAQRLANAGRSDAIPIVLLLMCAVASASLIATIVNANTIVLMIGIVAALFALSASTVMPAIAIQIIGPDWIRARLMAINLTFLAILGQGLGPVLVAVFSERWDRPDSLAFGLLTLTLIMAPVAAGLLWMARSRLATSATATA
ncbi:MAG: MFS transporter [Pseudomonadota bacterium]